MINVYKILSLRLRDYRKNKKEFIHLHGHIYEKDMINEFNIIRDDAILNTICKNIDNQNAIKKYPSIVKFIKNYEDNYKDELDIFFDDINNCDSDEFSLTYDNFTQNTIEIIKDLKTKTIETLHTNVHVLIDNVVTYEKILSEINKSYPIGKNSKLNAFNEISVYLIDLYFKYNNPPKIFPFRFGQKEAYDKFKEKLKLDKYWGLMIAPTGWGKSMMHYIFMGAFFQNSNKNILLITKRKDILSDVIKEINDEIQMLKEHNLFPDVEFAVCNYVVKSLDYKEINKHNKYSIIITNSDKLITRKKDSDDFISTNLDKIKWDKFGLVLFDEVHWAGSKRNVQFMNYLKDKIPYGIGSSATPIRKNLENQENIQKLYGDNYDIMYELTYVDAWANNVILKVDTVLFPILTESIIKNNNHEHEIKNNSKKIVVKKIKEVLTKSYKKKMIFFFKSRLSLLRWYEYLKKNRHFNDLTYHMSFTYNKTNTELDNDDDSDKLVTETKVAVNIDKLVMEKIKALGLVKIEIDKGIDNFKKEKSNAILLVVGRANEGFNDPPVDICVNLDFTKNRSMLLTLQKMGRTQRLDVDGYKQKGYYICPVISDDMDEFKSMVAECLHKYIKATSENSIKYQKYKSIPSDLIKDIIETFIVEGFDNYTNDDIMKRIRQLEKESSMTVLQFVENLKTYKITKHDDYYKVWLEDETFRDLGMPKFYDSIENFSWNLIKDEKYYDISEIYEVIQSIYYKHKEEINKLTNNEKKIKYIHELDNKVPSQLPWLCYNLNKSDFSFIYN